MKVLVTGGLGKVGQWVVRELLDGRDGRSAHEVTVLDFLPGPRDGIVKYLMGNVQDFGQVLKAAAGVDAVIHLAAIHNPNVAPTSVTFETNVTGTFNVRSWYCFPRVAIEWEKNGRGVLKPAEKVKPGCDRGGKND